MILLWRSRIPLVFPINRRKETMYQNTKIAIFKGKKIRKTLHNNEWWFVIVDVIAALTDSLQPEGYLKDMRRRDPELAKGWGQIATFLVDTDATIGGIRHERRPNNQAGCL